jgi:hypothetical protein
MNVIFKFRRGTASAAREKALNLLKKREGRGATPLFPGDPDPDSQQMFAARIASEEAARKLVAYLKRRRDIEYAELGPQRRPR